LCFVDGVGEGQINFVLKHEKDQMKAAICEEYQGKTEPKFTFIIVTKKINSRFLVTKDNKLINPAPGTILDDTITLPER
jgi:aubergine-like protein